MAITFHQIEQAIYENRTFFWEYSEIDGYVLRGRLPYHTETKVIGHTRDPRQAKIASHNWLCKKMGRGEQWQQLATLLSKYETTAPVHHQPKDKSDVMTLDLFGASENERGARYD